MLWDSERQLRGSNFSSYVTYLFLSPTPNFRVLYTLIYQCIYFFTSIQVWFSSSVVEAVLKMNLSGREPLPWKGVNASFQMQRLISQELAPQAQWTLLVTSICGARYSVLPGSQSQCLLGPHMIFQGSAQLRTSMGVSWWKDYFSFFPGCFFFNL